MVAKEFLDSDRVNFLIWRYLLEGNYRETAAKFQKEWHVKEPHRDFDFARHVKGHALVTVINRGLLYNGLEREHARGQLRSDAATDATASMVGVFGPLETHPPAKTDDSDVAPPDDAAEESRKRLQHPHPLSNGSPIKRPRLSNGYDNGADSGLVTTPMDIDPQQQSQDNHAYPSPLEGDSAPTPVARTDGPEQGTQVDKVEELSPDTTFIRLVDDPSPASDASSPTAVGAVAGENAPILLQCEWNPKDPSILAAAGTDALARVWTLSRTGAPEPGQDHVPSEGRSLLESGTPKSTTVTALCWSSDGGSVAVATDSGSQANIYLYAVDGANLQSIQVAETPVVKLSWSPNNAALLTISPAKAGALINVYYALTSSSLSYLVAGHDIAATPLDAAWTSDAEFLLCGGDVLVYLHCTESAITQVRKFDTRDDDSFTQVLFDSRSKMAATSSDKGTLDLWDESGQRRSISAHQGAITTMSWQPLPPSLPSADDERLIATGGEDCAILIWNAKAPDSKAKSFLTMDSPIVRLAFTPDGAFIAGATASQVLIWKVGNPAMPRASWSRPALPGWLSPKANSESDEEDEHCLCWDASGQKLAYGSNSRLAVINFSR